MRILWTLFKIAAALLVAIPLGIVALAVGLGILGSLLGLAIMALKLAFFAAVGYGFYRTIRFLGRKPAPATPRELPAPDPYYKDALHELDRELGHTPGR